MEKYIKDENVHKNQYLLEDGDYSLNNLYNKIKGKDKYNSTKYNSGK